MVPHRVSYVGNKRKVDSHKADVVGQIIDLSSLKDDWDGYGALPVFDDSIQNAIRVVKDEDVPAQYISDVYANNNGTVSIEWEHDDNRISVEIGIESFAYYVDYEGETFYEKEQPISVETIKRLANYARNITPCGWRTTYMSSPRN
jgi:hypothetical protein